MNIHEARDWFDGQIDELRQYERLTPLRRERLEAYERAAEALQIAELNMIRPHWYGKLKEIYNG